MFRDIQVLLDMLQRSHNSHILILFFDAHDKGIYNSFELVPLFRRFTDNHKAETFISQ